MSEETGPEAKPRGPQGAQTTSPGHLQFVIRTPHAVTFDATVVAVRVPTPTGQVGLRPRGEPARMAVEPGLIVIRLKGAPRFAATAGGLLDSDRNEAVLYTPFAVAGGDAEALMTLLDAALGTPDSELVARRRLGELTERLVRELRHRPGSLEGMTEKARGGT